MMKTKLPELHLQLQTLRSNVEEAFKKSRGLILALASACFLSIQSFGLQVLTVTVLQKEILLVNNCISLLLCLPLIMATRKPFFVKHRPDQGLLCLTALLNTAHQACFTYALNYIAFGEATAVFYGHLAFVAVLAWIFLKEPCGFFEVIIILVVTLGLVILLQPAVLFDSKDANTNGTYTASLVRHDDLNATLSVKISNESLGYIEYITMNSSGQDLNTSNWNLTTQNTSQNTVDSNTRRYIGVGLVVAATLLWSICVVIYKKLERVHFLTISFQSYFIGALFSGCICTATYHDVHLPTNPITILIMTGVGIAVFLGRTFLFAALHIEDAGPVTLVLSTNIVLCYMLEIFALQNEISVMSIGGATCILFSTIAMGIHRIIREKGKSKNKAKDFKRKFQLVDYTSKSYLSDETADELGALLQEEFPRYGGASRTVVELYLNVMEKVSDEEPETHAV
jgi:drug/metabolite transporter (DMT)-like permease